MCIISYLCHIMIEKEPTPYPERTEDVIVLVCEPVAEYEKPIVYQGTTISNALKDYYSFTTNREKVDVLKWIVTQPAFTELKRLSLAENKIYTLYTNQYDEILKTGETPNNLQIAQKFVANGYDVFLLANPHNTKSADFIIRQRNKIFYVEGKTSSGGSALSVRLSEGAKQANRIAINFSIIPQFHDLYHQTRKAFENNESLTNLYIFKGSVLVEINKDIALSPKYDKLLSALWNKRK